MASKELTELSIENSPPTVAPAAEIDAANATLASQGVADQSSPVISSEALKPEPEIVAPVVQAPVEAPVLEAQIETDAEDFQTKLEADRAAAETTADTSTSALESFLAQSQGEVARTAQEFSKEGGVDDITLELNDINDQIRREQHSLRRAKERILEKGGGLAGGATAEIGNLERVSLAKQADLAVIQMAVQGKYDSAKTIADRAVSAQLEQQQMKYDTLKLAYDRNIDVFDDKEQREYTALFNEYERGIQEEKDRLSEIKSFGLQALQAGAPTDVAQRAMSANTLSDAMSIAGSYLRPQTSVDTSAPTTKNFGTSDEPVWKQYNSATGQWEDVSGISGTPDVDKAEQAKTQLDFLLDTTDRILGREADVELGQEAYDPLYEGASPSKLLEFAGQQIKGETKHTRLNTYVDTLRANMLSLATDPSIKQFFGPQMSDADVRLMTAAGTSLRPGAQSSEELQAEAKRIKAVLVKLRAATTDIANQQPITDTSEVVTSPDGVEYIFTD